MATHCHGHFGALGPQRSHDMVVLPVELGEWLPGGQGHPLQDGQGHPGVRQAIVRVQEPLDGTQCQNVDDVEWFPATWTVS